MDRITELIKEEIKRQYGSLNKFSKEIGIPYSTLSNGLTRGVGSMTYDMVNKMCAKLNLKQAYDSDLTIFNDKFKEICQMLEQLDNAGVHTVETILKVEYDRCKKESKGSKVKFFNGITLVSEPKDFKKQARVNELINASATK